MIIRESIVEIIDYKTGSNAGLLAAEGAEYDNPDIKKQYLKQMRDYRFGVSKIYPDKEIKCYLVWVDEPRGKRISEVPPRLVFFTP